jgi:hypothetical protein
MSWSRRRLCRLRYHLACGLPPWPCTDLRTVGPPKAVRKKPTTLESARRSATNPADGIGMVPGWCKMCRSSSKITINLGYVDL